MRKLQLIALVLMVTACRQNEGNWIPLFDGSTLQGWHSYGKRVS